MINFLSMEEVAVRMGVSRQTIYNWYRFKRTNPDNEYSKLLPAPIKGVRNQLLWNEKDIARLTEFKEIIPQGRNGVMGSITQRYQKNSKWRKKEV